MRTNTPAAPVELNDRKATTSSTAGRATTPAAAEPVRKPAATTLLVGFDWGTNKSCVQIARPGSTETATTIVPTVVGYANEGIVEGILPGESRTLFGAEALKYRMHLRLVQPMVDGVIHDLGASRDFARHMRSLITSEANAEIRAVIGMPANSERTARENLRQAVQGVFDRVILIPEPFLAALGFRDDARLGRDGYVDPVSNSLFVDIGGGTTDVCLVQGYYPTANDQISFAFAGDKVDALIADGIKKTYPDVQLSMLKIREIKEQHAFVGKAAKPVVVSVIVGGKMRKLDLTAQIQDACEALLREIFEAVKTMIVRANPDTVTELMQNIVITGGGSRIAGLDAELQRLLTEEGFEGPSVSVVGEGYKEFVAKGALKAARQARDTQWQQLVN
jgi:rod shape-determining protein MreB and related proteins